VLRGINGVPGPVVPLQGGAGVALTFDPATHTVTLDVNMARLATCSDGGSGA
jgi:hypothetical protein